MSKEENKTIKSMAEALDKAGEPARQYFKGFCDGVKIMAEKQEQEVAVAVDEKTKER